MTVTNNPFHDKKTIEKYGKFDNDLSGFVNAEISEKEFDKFWKVIIQKWVIIFFILFIVDLNHGLTLSIVIVIKKQGIFNQPEEK